MKIGKLNKLSDTELLDYIEENYKFDRPEIIGAIIRLFDDDLENQDIDDIKENDDEYSFCEVNYLIGTDGEMDKRWDESLDSFIEDCLEIPEHIKFYFDEEKWKDDARVDGRGHSLDYYDGGEDEQEFDNETYYFYRR